MFFLEEIEHLDQVRGIATRGDIIIAPTDTGFDNGRSETPEIALIGYEGSWVMPGDALTLEDGRTYELQDYTAIPFVSIRGRTVVRQRRAEDVAAFLSDADAARHSGIIVNQLLSTAVVLDSRSAITRANAVRGPLVRVHVSGEGEYRDGADGLLLGRIGDARADIEATAAAGAGRGRSLARVVDRDAFQADLDARPWLDRYLAALDLLRHWGTAPVRPTVSGFGGHLLTALDRHDAVHSIVSPAAPFLVTDGDGYLLTAEHRRVLKLGIDEARAAESVVATGEVDVAIELLGFDIGSSAAAARAVRSVARRSLDHGLDITAFAHGVGEAA